MNLYQYVASTFRSNAIVKTSTMDSSSNDNNDNISPSAAADIFTPNQEGDEAQALPASWRGKPSALEPVTLYSWRVSPPAAKVRTLLRLFNINFQQIDGRMPGSKYRKVPVLLVGPGKFQINDSFAIAKALCPVLTGREMPATECELEKAITYKLMVALELQVFQSREDFLKFSAQFSKTATKDGFFAKAKRCMLTTMHACVLQRLAPNMIAKRYPDAKGGKESASDVLSLLKKFRDAAPDRKQFLSGGNQPGVLDASLFGAVAVFVECDIPFVKEMLTESGFYPTWYESIKTRLDGDVFGDNLSSSVSK
ncbi:GST N-terminal domain-containing protein [Pseudoscourfieldia marina]